MVASNPSHSMTSILILKGKYPSYLFEIVPTDPNNECHQVEFQGMKVTIKVRRDFDSFGTPPKSYLIEMLTWYTANKLKPGLDQISKKTPH